MNVLIIGFGSIGKRHYNILSTFKYIKKIAIVSKQKLDIETYSSIDDIKNIEEFDYFIIANETSSHYKTLVKLLEKVKNKKILVEKPLFEKEYLISNLKDNNIYIAYNMRFHPVIKEVKNLIAIQKIIYANVQVGQYLPDWRPNIDYRNNYSASKEKGGGVLLDLSHELDYIEWLLGKIILKSTINRKISSLEITSDDLSTSIGYANSTVINVTMDYLNKNFIRKIMLYSNEMTIRINLVKNNIKLNYNDGRKEKIKFGNVARNESFTQMHKSILKYEGKDVCSFQEGLNMLKLIGGVENG